MAHDLRGWIARQRAPFVLILAVSLGVAAFVALLAPRAVLGLTFADGRPWGVLTYPWAIDAFGSSLGLISLVFLIVLLLQFGATLEGEIGGPRLAAFWAAAVVLYGLLGAALGASPLGPWLPASALLVAWCARNPTATIMLYGIVPIRGTWLAGLTALGVAVGYRNDPLVAVAMLLPLGLAWAFAADRLPISYRGGSGRGFRGGRPKMTTVRGGRQYDDAYFDDVKAREQEREERERLRKLFEGK